MTTTTSPILLYGSTGYIGSNFLRHVKARGLPVVCGKARLEDRQQVLHELQETKPRYVIHAAGVAGKPNIDWCETHREETMRVNGMNQFHNSPFIPSVVGTLNLVDVAKTENLNVAVVGSGCIYEYDASHPMGSGIGFTEEDTPNFQGRYTLVCLCIRIQ